MQWAHLISPPDKESTRARECGRLIDSIPTLNSQPQPMANASAAPLHPLLSASSSSSSSSRSPALPSPPSESITVAANPSKPSTNSSSPSLRRYSPFSRRRDIVAGIALTAVLWKEPLASEAREVEVGSYLPPCPTDPAFVLFKATSKDTPALRAGNVQPYEFILPPTWKQTRVANILSGNYCQPKCAEPWVEVKFEDENQGKVQIVASPLIRLTNKPDAKIEDIGNPENVIASLGPFVTGNTFDSDELLEASIEKHGDQTYYKYELETPFASTGSHNLAKATAKGNTVILFVASANDKQWPVSEKILKAMLDSFQV